MLRMTTDMSKKSRRKDFVMFGCDSSLNTYTGAEDTV